MKAMCARDGWEGGDHAAGAPTLLTNTPIPTRIGGAGQRRESRQRDRGLRFFHLPSPPAKKLRIFLHIFNFFPRMRIGEVR